MKVFEHEDGTLSIEGHISYDGIENASCHRDYKKIAISKCRKLPAKFARGLMAYQKVETLWLWCDVFRTAMSYVLSLPELRVVDILCMRRPGRRVPSFEAAVNLREFRCNMGLTESDLIAISKAPRLRELGAQGCGITPRAVQRLSENESLEALDLECSGITDDLALELSQFKQLLSLEVGSNPLTERGLKAICKMQQLTRLDIWQTEIDASALESLVSLNKLEYLSLGGAYDDVPKFSGDDVIPILNAIPSLRSVWLDGVSLTGEQKEELNERYQYFRN
jgi:hypothetical protein